jgi:hypothetical protein
LVAEERRYQVVASASAFASAFASASALTSALASALASSFSGVHHALAAVEGVGTVVPVYCSYFASMKRGEGWEKGRKGRSEVG